VVDAWLWLQQFQSWTFDLLVFVCARFR
jgi:hypothetical protein